MEFDLLLYLKEVQLQHGLRADDFARYHRYTTGRLRTLRRQLGLTSDPRRPHSQDPFASGPLRPEHFQLLALYAERCWASAEEQRERRRSPSSGSGSPSGGLPPAAQHRKRLNKSAAWAQRLRDAAARAAAAAAEAEGTERTERTAAARLCRETEAYALEARGRAAAAHGDSAEAKRLFLAARDAYDALRTGSGPARYALLLAKLAELDDRVVHCMLRLGEDPAAYKPRGDEDDAAQQRAAASVEWNGRQLRVAAARVRDALREAAAIATGPARAKALETPGAVIPAGQQSRALDLTDRRVGYYNDALAHARQELRSIADGRQKTELQLVVHYLIFQAAHETLQRTLFMVEVHARRFRATEKSLAQQQQLQLQQSPPQQQQQQKQKQQQVQPRSEGARKRKEIPPSHYASPLEIVRLYDAALETLGEMELLPGVAGREDVDALLALCRAGKLLYTGEAWRIAGNAASAQDCYAASRALLDGAPPDPRVEAMRLLVEKSALQLAAKTILLSSDNSAPAAAAEPLQYLANAGEQEAVTAQNVVKFPPDYQAVPCKPVFVDIASMYVDYPALGGAVESTQKGGEAAQPDATAAAPPKGGKGWKWSWGWRKS